MNTVRVWTARLACSSCRIVVLAILLGAATPAQVLEQVILNVNGEILTKWDLEERQIAAIGQELGRPVSIAELRGDPSLQQSLAAMTPAILAEAIDELLVVQHARDLGFDVTDEDVDNVLAAIKRDKKLQSDDDLWSFLHVAGMRPSSRRESVRRQILVEQVRQHVGGRVHVSDDDARAFFAAHRHTFATPATVTYREIFVAVPPEPPLTAGATAHQARDKAMMRFVAARDGILRGAPFAEVAARYSESTEGAAGALIGPVAMDALSARLQTVLTRLQPGEVSTPVKSDDGYRLIQLEALVPATAPTFEAVRDAVIDRASADLRAAATRRYMARLRERALITWKNQEFQQAYERYRRLP